MIKFYINTETKKLIQDIGGNLGPAFYQKPWREATQQEVDDDLLKQAKQTKVEQIQQLKIGLNKVNMPLYAFEILTLTAPISLSTEKVCFEFSLQQNKDDLTEARTVLTALNTKLHALSLGLITQEKAYIQYSCKIIEADGSKREGVVYFDLEVALSVINHGEARALNNILAVRNLITNINNANSLEELEAACAGAIIFNDNRSQLIA